MPVAKLTALDVRHDTRHQYYRYPADSIRLPAAEEEILVSKKELIFLKGGAVSRKLKYEEEIISAIYTSFDAEISDCHNNTTLVVLLSKNAHLYYQDGRSEVINFPFQLRNAFAFEHGLILERDSTKSSVLGGSSDFAMMSDNLSFQHSGVHSPVIGSNFVSSSPFFTLIDPSADLGSMVSSSTSSISTHENLILFPQSSKCSLSATFNSADRTIIIYHSRFLNRSKNGNRSTRRKPSLNNNGNISTPHPKKLSIASTPTGSRLLEEERSSVSEISGVNIEKRRPSGHTGVLSIDRMPSGGEGLGESIMTPTIPQFDASSLRKDVIITKIESLLMSHDKKAFDIFNLYYGDKEAIVISNRATAETQVLIFKASSNQVNLPQYQSVYNIKCLHSIPLSPLSGHDGYLVVLKDVETICLMNPFLNAISGNLNLKKILPPISKLEDSSNYQLALSGSNGKNYTLKLVLKPTDDLTTKCLDGLKYLAGPHAYEFFWLQWCSALALDDNKSDWNAFVTTLLLVLIPQGTTLENVDEATNEITEKITLAKKLKNEMADTDYSFIELTPYFILALHLIREEMKLDSLSSYKVNKLGLLLSQFCVWMGWPDVWHKYYMINVTELDKTIRFSSPTMLDAPPNLLHSLSTLFGANIVPYITYSQLSEEDETVDELITPRTFFILRLFEAIVSTDYGPNEVVDMMCEYGITSADLETYPPGVSIPLKEYIARCQENPTFEWTAGALELVGRKDLTEFLNSADKVTLKPSYQENTNTVAKDIHHILANILENNEPLSAWDGQSEADRINITKLIFDEDRRFYEITKLLQSSKVQTATLVAPPSVNEYDLILLQRALATIVALRTLTIPIGRGALFFSSRMPLMTEKYPIPKLNFNTLISPSMTNILLDKESIDQETVQWGYFHNGASSGLSISRDAKGISGSWIIFNRPPVLNAQHAGFLLGLGLNGHLKKLEEWHIYNYLGPKHVHTSVGLLIGMAASSKGTMDVKLTKVLSVHAVALLPQGANDLNVPLSVQTSGLIGIGLLYLESQHRRMSEILLSQINGIIYQGDQKTVNEGYRLAAGIALGYINLGKGDDLRGLNDTHVVDKLVDMAVSSKDIQTEKEFDNSCGGAIIALTFIYMKTNNDGIAHKLSVPETEQLLDYVRPDLLFLRCVGKNLIMWDQIGNSKEWIDSQVPLCLLKKFSIKTIKKLNSDQLNYFHILGGCCLSIALKYASTGNMKARDTILEYLDYMMAISSLTATNYDEKLAVIGASNVQDILALSASVIMAGTGDLEIFRRLRCLFGKTGKDMNYGNYMASSMALGLLFLGGGQYAFDNSNFGIAALLTSLYPIFPKQNSDHEVHLQALRHFWALAIEPRCLVIRDVNSSKPCKIPITITLKNERKINCESPCLLPNLNEIISVQTNSVDHYKVEIDFKKNSKYFKVFEKSLTLYIYKRKNYQVIAKSVSSLMKNQISRITNESNSKFNKSLNKLIDLGIFSKLDDFEKKLYLEDATNDDEINEDCTLSGLSINNIIDSKIEIQDLATRPSTVEDLWNLKLVFAFTDKLYDEELHFLSMDFIEKLKVQVWVLSQSLKSA